MVENEIDNKYDNNVEGINVNLTEEKKNKKKVNNNANNEPNNDAETYNKFSSKGAFKYIKHSSKNDIQKEDKLSQKESTNKKEEKNKDKEKNKEKKKKKKKSKNGEEKNITSENDINSKKNSNNKIISNEEDYKEIDISDTILSEIVLNEKPKTIAKDMKKKIKGRNNINIVILGYNEVGKSAFCIRFVENKFEDFYIPSIGIEKFVKMTAYNSRNYKINFAVICGSDKLNKWINLIEEADFFFFFMT